MRDLEREAFSDLIDLERVGSRAGVKVCVRPVPLMKTSFIAGGSTKCFEVRITLSLKFTCR